MIFKVTRFLRKKGNLNVVCMVTDSKEQRLLLMDVKQSGILTGMGRGRVEGRGGRTELRSEREVSR